MNKLFLSISVAALLVIVGCTDKSGDMAAEDHSDDTEHMEMSASDMLAENLEAHGAEFASVLEGLSDEQLNYKEADDRWSILEISEHIVMANGMVAGMLGQMIEAGPNPELAADSSMTGEQIAGVLGDRSQKYQAPDDFQPTGKFESASAAIAAFTESLDSIIATSTNADVDLAQYFAEHPAFGVLDGSKWVTFSLSHGMRHVDQMREVIASANYPSTDA